MKYDIIYADPPWSYRVWSKKGNGRSAISHYPVIDKKSLQELPISSIASDNSVLFLWVTPPTLEEGLELIKKWGFTYKTKGFTWVKRNKVADSWFWGMGYYTRANSEDCLIATRGNILPRQSRGVHQVIGDVDDLKVSSFDPILIDRIMQHSEKPAIVRDKIVELFGDLPRVELFARQRVDGWDAIGYDIDGKDIREVLNEGKGKI